MGRWRACNTAGCADNAKVVAEIHLWTDSCQAVTMLSFTRKLYNTLYSDVVASPPSPSKRPSESPQGLRWTLFRHIGCIKESSKPAIKIESRAQSSFLQCRVQLLWLWTPDVWPQIQVASINSTVTPVQEGSNDFLEWTITKPLSNIYQKEHISWLVSE